MSFLDDITALILTYNESPNIARTLDALWSFPEILVLDSGSTDGTIQIIDRYPNARCMTRAFDTHAEQWNHGLTNCGIQRPWVLALDADYRLSDALVNEISKLRPEDYVSGFRLSFRYCVCGHPLSSTLYPAHVALYRRDKVRYIQEGHTQKPLVEGVVKDLRNRIDHDDRKPLSRWLDSQQRYARLEADHLLKSDRASLSGIDRMRLLAWPAPILVLFYTLCWKRCLLDGWPGWFYVLQRTLAEIMLALELLDHRLKSSLSDMAKISPLNADTGKGRD